MAKFIKKHWFGILFIVLIGGSSLAIYYQSEYAQGIVSATTARYEAELRKADESKNSALSNLRNRLNKDSQEKIDALKQDILDRLAQCETGGIVEQNSAIVLDTNNKMSIGRYMWQRESVVYYVKRLYGKDIDRTEAILIAIDEHPSIKLDGLTLDVMFEIKDGADAWYNCTKKHGFKAEISIIKKLQ
jgi:hypothetical protein